MPSKQKNKKNQKKIWLLCCNSLTFRSCSIELFFCFPWKTTARYLQSFPIWVDRWVFSRFRLAWVGFPNPAKTREVPNLNLGFFMCGSELPCPLGSTITVTWQWKKMINNPPWMILGVLFQINKGKGYTFFIGDHSGMMINMRMYSTPCWKWMKSENFPVPLLVFLPECIIDVQQSISRESKETQGYQSPASGRWSTASPDWIHYEKSHTSPVWGPCWSPN